MRKMLVLVLAVMVSPLLVADEVNIYSARQENLIKPLLDRYSEKTGVRINLITGGADELTTRLELEGANSPADLLLTVDVGRLYRAKELNLLQPVKSEMLKVMIPSTYRDPDQQWYALSLRARVIVYDKSRIDPGQISSYEDLADPRWAGQVCVRSSSNIYNQSLVAAMISHQGVEATEAWVRGLVSNLARSPQGGDRDQISAVAIGQCSVALVNTYYLAGMLNSPVRSERRNAERVGVIWPDQAGRGTHINISGAGVTRHAPNVEAAIRLLEYLVSDEAQSWYAETNNEYPIRADIPVSDTLGQWGGFQADEISLDQLGLYNAEAVRLMDRAGWR